MNYFQAIFLGVLQGLTEFLPISSSGHLVIAQYFFPGFNQTGILFDVVLHLGTLIAIVFFFRKKILTLNTNYLRLLIIGTIPAVFVGYFFQSIVEEVFNSLFVVGIALLVTGMLNKRTNKLVAKSNKITDAKAFVIGIFQSIALIPGISRSGSTIFAGAKQDIKKAKAAEFSFILSVPAVLGANVLQFAKHKTQIVENTSIYLVGLIFAFISGLLAINLVFRFLKLKKFNVFAYYCFILGAIILINELV